MPTALVVDDSAMDRRLIGGLLEREADCQVEYAENGREALARIQSKPVDIVLTDLQMPEMDGLNLVQAVRIQHADLPVVLITGKGSEELAIQALELGAASYVPKAKLAEILPETIDDVLAIVRADRSYESLIACMRSNEFTFELDNNPLLIDPLVDLVQQMVFGVGLCDAIGRVRIGIAVEQALLNAMYRGNLEIGADQMEGARDVPPENDKTDLVQQRCSEPPYADRKTLVQVSISRDQVCIQVRDEGPGFDVSTVPESGDPSALEREGGRGLVLMRTFMDEVSFNQKGNEVTMIKRRDAQPAAAK